MQHSRQASQAGASSQVDEGGTPKPESPTDLSTRTWAYAARKTWREFNEDQCTDLAAGLTYYAVLAIFPAAIALISVLGVLNRADQAVDTVLEVLGPLVSAQVLADLDPVLRDLAGARSAGLALFLGLALALWSASAYVAAFGRAMNRILEVKEGRPLWKLRPWTLLITAVIIVLIALVLLMLIISGPLASSIGDVVGAADVTVTIWSIAKWPVLAVVVTLIVALLYYATPNIEQPRFRWISIGAALAIVVAVLASVGFSLYVATFANYDKTYGSLAGVVVGLLFLWLTNLSLLLGAEVNSELERGRELQAGIAAEHQIQLPLRDTRKIDKDDRKDAEHAEMGRELREQHAREQDLEKQPQEESLR